MRLRKLDQKDAPLMLEWMHDANVVQDLKTDFLSKTIDDCHAFIEASKDPSESLHLAVVNDEDEYIGTVSLKHIVNGTAEFGITVRKCAMGKGYSIFAMKSILDIGINELKLQKIYWCVDPLNKRAVRFYDKNSYKRSGAPSEATGYTQEEKDKFIWYVVEA